MRYALFITHRGIGITMQRRNQRTPCHSINYPHVIPRARLLLLLLFPRRPRRALNEPSSHVRGSFFALLILTEKEDGNTICSDLSRRSVWYLPRQLQCRTFNEEYLWSWYIDPDRCVVFFLFFFCFSHQKFEHFSARSAQNLLPFGAP